jgi:hypothetical protein
VLPQCGALPVFPAEPAPVVSANRDGKITGRASIRHR